MRFIVEVSVPETGGAQFERNRRGQLPQTKAAQTRRKRRQWNRGRFIFRSIRLPSSLRSWTFPPTNSRNLSMAITRHTKRAKMLSSTCRRPLRGGLHGENDSMKADSSSAARHRAYTRSANLYPTRHTVSRYFGCEGLSSIFSRILRMNTVMLLSSTLLSRPQMCS